MNQQPYPNCHVHDEPAIMFVKQSHVHSPSLFFFCFLLIFIVVVVVVVVFLGGGGGGVVHVHDVSLNDKKRVI